MSNLQSSLTDLKRLIGFMDRIGSSLKGVAPWNRINSRLFHYTNLEGFTGIITSDDLWLTHAQYCNDDSELKHGLDLTRRVIQQEADGANSERRAYLEELTDLVCGPALDPIYICCFCEQDDLLSQWRAYAANATGISIEFQTQGLYPYPGPEIPPQLGAMRFWKVFYSEETQRSVVQGAINHYPSTDPEASSTEWARWTAGAIHFLIPTFKNSDFEEEREWRLIFSPALGSPAEASYRVSRGMLTPYFTVKEILKKTGITSGKLAIASVRVGPGPSRQLNAASARMFLDQHGYSQVTVTTSTTPYRG